MDASGGGQTSAYSYFPASADHRLQTIHHKYPNGATLSRFDYTYDPVGNIQTFLTGAWGPTPTRLAPRVRSSRGPQALRQQADSTAMIWEYGYDNADQLIRAVKHATDPQATVLQRFAYGYDPAGNRLFEQIDDQVTAWTYDRLNRLVTQQAGGWLRVAGTLSEPARVTVAGRPAAIDAAGLFVGGVQVAAGTTRFTVTATDAAGNVAVQPFDVDQTGPTKAFTFDANGNMTSDGTRTFEWDGRNQAVAMDAGTQRTEYVYDGQQRRRRVTDRDNGIIQSERLLLWCDTEVCEERSSDNVSVTRRPVRLGEQSGGTSRFFSLDAVGSVRAVTGTSGTLMARYDFDPYGRPELVFGTDSTLVRFTGHEWYPSGNTWLARYRAYDPTLARWSSQDPLGPHDGPNLYQYVRNNPLRYVDAQGLQLHEYKPPPSTPPAGCTAEPWIPKGHGLLSKDSMLNWVLISIQTVRIPGPRNPRGFVLTCTCVFEARGIREIVNTYEDFERKVTCCESTYTESRRMTYESEHYPPYIGAIPARRFYSNGIPVGSKCLCANPPKW